ncbi:tetratricopeptide repeat protein [Dysgonomonas sp. ZJ709]|uniref:tetratricopeptide repeat protein n=1 Tax=Dysgonomonas sp. ZJ709 TaxID=2709797 RepID=UPI0013ECA1B5|nr:tetratricopeptide repeat protein [Dysgonomonas sp. ZJ709]
MKISELIKVKYFFLIILGCLFACEKNNNPSNLLDEALAIVENNPSDALILLDSINNPENMDKDDYMKFVTTYVEARFKMDHDMIEDTLIFEAQKHFNLQNNTYYTPLANYYAGIVYYDKQVYDKSLECFLKASESARKSNNNKLIGKSLHAIGNLYFDRNVMDSAILRYNEALIYYNKEQNTGQLQGQVTNLIGRAYEAIDNLDSAYFYFDKSLEIANKLNDRPSQAIATSNIGVVFRRMEDYNKAAAYFLKSLEQTSNSNDSLRIYLNLSKLYNKKNQLDSSKYYIDLMEDRLAEIKNNKTLLSAYGSLSTYNRQSGNEQKAEYYNKLEEEIRNRITEANNSQKLIEIEKKYQMSLREKELESLQIRSYLYMSIGISVAILIVLITWFRNRNNRLKHAQEVEKNKLLEQKLENLLFLQSIYHNIITEWAGIEDEVKSLALDLGVKEEPTIYLRIRKMVENVKGKTNQQLIENAKDFLKKEPFGEQAIELLNEKELLIIMLSYCKYSKKEMSIILGDMAGSKNLHVQKLDIQRKLLNLGMTESRTNEILFAKNDDKK